MTASETTALQSMRELYPATLDCVHCGLCLSSCPTYLETGRESSSPRGRVYLMRGVAEGKIALGDVVAEEASLCLGCRACETACPSGVQYGAMLEQTRAAVADAGLRGGFAYALERFALRHVVPNKRVLGALVSLLGAAQALRLDALAAPLLPARLREMRALLPPVPARRERERLPAFTPALGAKRGRVALLEGCVMPELFGALNRATVRVLARTGFDVLVPGQQSCCGALHAHNGDMDRARELARNNLAAFALEGVDAVVTNSAGCGAALREQGHWLPGEGEALAQKTRDICEFLDAVGIPEPRNEIIGTACYDDPCHLAHGQRVVDAPRRLLAQIPGLRLVAHDDPASCCGAAGIYNLTQPAMSRAVLARKLDSLTAANPDYIVTGNPGCLMQLAAGAKQRGMSARVVHPVELLDRALAE